MSALAVEVDRGSTADAATTRGKSRLLTLDDLDGRTRAAQMVARTIEAIESDLGGAAELSAAESALVRRAAITGAMAEDLAARWMTGEAVDPAAFCTLSNAERRLLETVGLKRRQRDVTTPAQWLNRKSDAAA